MFSLFPELTGLPSYKAKADGGKGAFLSFTLMYIEALTQMVRVVDNTDCRTFDSSSASPKKLNASTPINN